MVLGLGLVLFAVISTNAQLGDTGWEPNDVFDDEAQPFGQLSNGGCRFTDVSTAIIDVPIDSFTTKHGERRTLGNSSAQQYTSHDVTATTDNGCASTTKRVRWGSLQTTGLLRKVKFNYDVYGRNTICFFNAPSEYGFTSCGVAVQIAELCSETYCPDGYIANRDCECEAYSPLILSLVPGARFDISTVDQGVLFDVDGDGTNEKMATPLDASNVGFLYLKGGEHNGRRLFGDRNQQKAIAGITRNGFEALRTWDEQIAAEPDSNGKRHIGPPDGSIDSRDGIWNLLGVWLDRNRNGAMDEGEFKTLAELGIVRIELQYVSSQRNDGHGNRLYVVGKYYKEGETAPYFITDYFAVVRTLD